MEIEMNTNHQKSKFNFCLNSGSDIQIEKRTLTYLLLLAFWFYN